METAILLQMESRPNEVDLIISTILDFDDLNRISTFNQRDESLYNLYINQLEEEAIKGNTQSKMLLLLCELKNCIFCNMMEIGWKIIIYSCACPGFKFGKQGDIFKVEII